MLVTFAFKNHGPFKEECVFDMRAITAYKEHINNVAYPDGKTGILKSAMVFGANAAGKSQFVDAYRSYRRMVMESFGGIRDTLDTYYNPFLFTDTSPKEKTEYEGVFVDKTGEYRYGFSHNKEQVFEEWLYYVNPKTNRTSIVFERAEQSLNLGASVRSECRKYVDDIASDTLALSFFERLSLKTKLFDNAVSCIAKLFPITSKMCVADINYRLKHYFEYEFNKEEKARLMELLASIDFGINDITVDKAESGVRVLTHHIGADGKDYTAPLEIESSGTKKLIALYSISTGL